MFFFSKFNCGRRTVIVLCPFGGYKQFETSFFTVSGAEAVEGIVHANEYTSSLFGKSIKEISLPEGASIGAVIRHGELIMPRSEVELCLNDHLIIFLANKNMMSEVEVLFKTN